MPGKPKISRYLSHDEQQRFVQDCLAVSAEPTGEQIRELYLEAYGKSRGEPPSVQACINWRNSVMDFEVELLREKARAAEQITAIAQSGLEMSDATASLLNAQLLDRLLAKGRRGEDGSVEAYDLDDLNTLSLSLSRLRLGDQRAVRLELLVKEQAAKIALLEARAAEQEEANERARKKAEALQQALDPDTQLTQDEIRQRVVETIDAVLLNKRPAQ